MQSREALYIWRALYISFTIAAGGFRPALSVGGIERERREAEEELEVQEEKIN